MTTLSKLSSTLVSFTKFRTHGGFLSKIGKLLKALCAIVQTSFAYKYPPKLPKKNWEKRKNIAKLWKKFSWLPLLLNPSTPSVTKLKFVIPKPQFSIHQLQFLKRVLKFWRENLAPNFRAKIRFSWSKRGQQGLGGNLAWSFGFGAWRP